MSNEGDLGRELSGSEVDRCVREVETSGGRSASRDSRGIALAIPSNLPRAMQMRIFKRAQAVRVPPPLDQFLS